MKILSYKINFVFLLLFSIVMLSSCGNFKIVTINDMNKNESNNSALKSKVEKSKPNSKTEKYKEFESKAQQVVDAAREQLGTPHLDQNPHKKPAVDCSGMTCKSYSIVGVNLPRTTTGQAEAGKFVPKKELQKGDLVFFSSKKGHIGISHVGLISRVDDGQTFFIHTSTSRGVVEDDFYMEHWQNVFVTARRIL